MKKKKMMMMMHFYDIMDTGIGKTEEREGKKTQFSSMGYEY